MKKQMLSIKVKPILRKGIVDTVVKYEGDDELVLAFLVNSIDTLITHMAKSSNGKKTKEQLYSRFGEMLVNVYTKK